MSTGSSHANTSTASRPIHTQGALRNSKFLSPYEIVSAPLKLSELRETFLNILFVSLLALFLCCSAASFPLFFFMLFCRF